MVTELLLPSFRFQASVPSLWQMMRQGIGDPASVIPATILDQPAVQLPGPGAPLVVADPVLARLVLNDRAGDFARDKFIRRLFRRSWGKGLAAAEGADWQRQRRAAAPALRPQAVRDYLARFAACADAVITELPQDQPVDLVRLSGRIVARIVFSTLVEVPDWVDPDQAAVAIRPYVDRIARFSVTDLLPLPERVIDRLQRISNDSAVIELRSLAARIARARDGKSPPNDMIALIEQSGGPTKDNIQGLFPAAMDTTVSGASWALYTLARRSHWQEQLAAESLAAGDHPALEDLPSIRRATQESLRLYPPAPLLSRSAATRGELGGFPIQRGQPILVAIYAMHRHRTLWDRPDDFDPDRFLPGQGNQDAFMPFGTGPRICPAAQFATAEIAIILARLLARFQLTPAGLEPEVSLRVTTHSVGSLEAVLHRR